MSEVTMKKKVNKKLIEGDQFVLVSRSLIYGPTVLDSGNSLEKLLAAVPQYSSEDEEEIDLE